MFRNRRLIYYSQINLKQYTPDNCEEKILGIGSNSIEEKVKM